MATAQSTGMRCRRQCEAGVPSPGQIEIRDDKRVFYETHMYMYMCMHVCVSLSISKVFYLVCVCVRFECSKSSVSRCLGESSDSLFCLFGANPVQKWLTKSLLLKSNEKESDRAWERKNTANFLAECWGHSKTNAGSEIGCDSLGCGVTNM